MYVKQMAKSKDEMKIKQTQKLKQFHDDAHERTH